MSVRYYPIDFPSCFDPSQTRLIPDRTDQGWFCRRNAINAQLCEADPISVSCLRVYNNERRFLGTTHGELCPLFLFLYINHNDLVSLGAGTGLTVHGWPGLFTETSLFTAIHHHGHCERGDKSELFQHYSQRLITRALSKYKKYVNICGCHYNGLIRTVRRVTRAQWDNQDCVRSERWGEVHTARRVQVQMSSRGWKNWLIFYPLFRVRFQQFIFSFCDKLWVVNLHFSTVGCLVSCSEELGEAESELGSRQRGPRGEDPRNRLKFPQLTNQTCLRLF